MIFPIISQSFSSNSYIIPAFISKKLVIIDTGISPEEVIKKIYELEINEIQHEIIIILTHCHYDHVAGVLKIKEKIKGNKIKVFAHEFCANILKRGDSNIMLSKIFNQNSNLKINVDHKLKDGETINLGEDKKIEVIHTPGHTQGSISLYEVKTKSLFSGDTIFKDGIGRTDLPTGNLNLLKKSIERIIMLKKERGVKKIFPGHGEIGSGEDIEKVYNEWFK